MSVSRSLVRIALTTFASLGFAALVGCSSSDGAGTQLVMPGGAAGQADTSGGAPSAGAAGSAGSIANGGSAPTEGGAPPTNAGAGGTSAGASGAPSGGAAPTAGAAGMGGDPDAAGDTPPPRKLNVTVGGNKQITHQVGGSSAGLDTRTTQIGKLAIDLGVTSGGYQPWLGKRGYHVMGVSFPMCGGINDWSKGRDYDGDCRLNTFDGLPHGTQSAVSPADSIAAHVKANLMALAQNAGEDWGYFLNADNSVRWSDVVFTGMSHGATTAAVIGKSVRLWRVVSRSGPRDNTCGNGSSVADFSAAAPPWKATCPDTNIASWLDAKSATPIDRFFSLSGKQDVEWGDIMFAMERMKYPGAPVRWDLPDSVLTGVNRLYSDEGHLDFLSAAKTPPRTNEALNLAFGIPTANQNPTF